MRLRTINKAMVKLHAAAVAVGAKVDCQDQGLQWLGYVDLPPGKIIMGAHGAAESALSHDGPAILKAIEKLTEWLGNPIEDGCETDPSRCDHCLDS